MTDTIPTVAELPVDAQLNDLVDWRRFGFIWGKSLFLIWNDVINVLAKIGDSNITETHHVDYVAAVELSIHY